MFKNDSLTVKRDVYEVVKGEAVHKAEVVMEDVPCHLSLNLTNTVTELNVPYVKTDYTLFLDYDSSIDIKENDTLLVETSKGRKYILYAGTVGFYDLSIQIKCIQKNVVES